MDQSPICHQTKVNGPLASELQSPLVGAGQSTREAPGEALDFDTIYEQDFDFAWRSLRRLGVPAMSLEDAAQDLFIVVCRRLREFAGRSTVRTWIFSIAIRVAKEYRRRAVRQQFDIQTDSPMAPTCPSEQCVQSESVRLLDRLLGELDEDKRVVFILADLEEMSVPEIAVAVGANPNTIYTRLRAARRLLNQAIERHQAASDLPASKGASHE
jgi:RNA polymerase sigma-70 factor, ECF subfamily